MLDFQKVSRKEKRKKNYSPQGKFNRKKII